MVVEQFASGQVGLALRSEEDRSGNADRPLYPLEEGDLGSVGDSGCARRGAEHGIVLGENVLEDDVWGFQCVGDLGDHDLRRRV